MYYAKLFWRHMIVSMAKCLYWDACDGHFSAWGETMYWVMQDFITSCSLHRRASK